MKIFNDLRIIIDIVNILSVSTSQRHTHHTADIPGRVHLYGQRCQCDRGQGADRTT